jgi:DNA-binding LacI/PurR family transcriptional regulator
MLPPAKELGERYGVCHQTLRTALTALCDDRRLLRYKKRYRVPGLVSGRSSDTVVLVARGDRRGNLLVMSPRVEEHLRVLERQCSRAHVRLAVYTYDSDTNLLYGAHGQRVTPQRLGDAHLLLGALLWEIGYSPAAVTALIDQLSAARCPIAVLGESGRPLPAPRRGSWSAVRLFSIAPDTAAGRYVGQYLLDRGHRKVAFVSPVHAALWSQDRLTGLRDAFRAAGFDGSVSVFLLDRHDQSDFLRQLQEQLRSEGPLQMAGFGQKHLSLTYTSERTQHEIRTALEHQAMGVSMARLLERAAAEPDTTAWVVASDTIALLCLDFLRHSGIRVPADISVIGFDDSLQAFLYRLTSFNFDGAAAINAALGHLLASPGPRRGGVQQGVELEGFVAERSTTAALTGRS